MEALFQNVINEISTITTHAEICSAQTITEEGTPPGIAEHHHNKTINPITRGQVNRVMVVERLVISKETVSRPTMGMQGELVESS